MNLSRLAMVFLGTVTFGVSTMAIAAEQFDIGKREYDTSCANCHGRDGMVNRKSRFCPPDGVHSTHLARFA